MTSALSSYEFAASPGYARKLLRGYARLFDQGPVADLGSGRGYFLEALRSRGVAAIGVDIGDEAIAHARALGVDCVQEDALAFLENARGLRGVFASHLIEHLPPEAAERMIKLAAAAMEPGGRFVVVTPNLADFRTLTEIFWLDTTHVRPYPPRLIATMMERHGFKVERIGRGQTPQGKRAIGRVLLGRLRFGRDYGVSEVFVSARRG